MQADHLVGVAPQRRDRLGPRPPVPRRSPGWRPAPWPPGRRHGPSTRSRSRRPQPPRCGPPAVPAAGRRAAGPAGGPAGPVPAPPRWRSLRGQPGLADHAIVDDPGTALADGAEAVFRLERDAELAHHDHVERGPQLPGHLGRDRHAAPRQADHHGIGAAQVQQPAAPAGVPRPHDQRTASRTLLRGQRGPAAGSATPSGSTSWLRSGGSTSSASSRAPPDTWRRTTRVTSLAARATSVSRMPASRANRWR